MKCGWDRLLKILPVSLKNSVDKIGRDSLQEIRLRVGLPVILVCKDGDRILPDIVSKEQIDFVVNTASRYSPWSAATIAQGYLTAPGGHRIGVCGDAVIRDGQVTGFRSLRSLCIRVARDFPGVSRKIPTPKESLLIVGPPGSGKTTLLRDLIRRISAEKMAICVVDERGEIFPDGMDFEIGEYTDVLTGCPKPVGLMMALRTMGPHWLAVDEITDEKDCDSLLEAAWCGVKLLATVHAADKKDLLSRKIYESLMTRGIFANLIILKRDKSFVVDRGI